MSKKEQAIQLRKAGYTYSYIADATGLSKSTLSYHLAKIPFTPNKESKQTINEAREAGIKRNREKKLATYTDARARALSTLGTLSARDITMIGIGLYIGEGSKTQDIVRLVNADPNVIKLYIQWLRQFGLVEKNIMLRVHTYPDVDIQSAENFWLKSVGLPTTSLQRTSIDTRAGKKSKKQGIHPFGTAHVTVRSVGNKEFGVILSRTIGEMMKEVLQCRPVK